MSNLPPEQDAPLPRQIVLEPASSLDLPVSAPEPAKLRVYLGAAPGVGKTYHMLQDANLLRKQGVDIVIGLVESHGRAETEAPGQRTGDHSAATDSLSLRGAERDGYRRHPRPQTAHSDRG